MIPPCTHEVLIEAARAGFVDAWRLMAGNLPDGAIAEIDGLALAVTGLDIASCNPAMPVRAPDDPQSALEAARRFFADHNVPWALYAGDAAARALAPAARNLGMVQDTPEPAMLLDTAALRELVPPAGLQVLTVHDEASMELYLNTAASGFGVPPESLAIWANADLLDTPGLRYYLGILNDEPVATSCVYVLHGLAIINMVSTIPSRRRGGLGEAMTRKAIDDGIALGGDAVYLHASQMGFSTYQRMGFRQVYSYEIWAG